MTAVEDKQALPLQERLERSILHGLGCEWDNAFWGLPASYRKHMRRPFFALRSLTGRLGYWSSDHYEISLGRDFVLNHPWDAVREVLLHEMAHQLTHCFFAPRAETPHGPSFQRACGLLKANPRATGTYPPLDARVWKDAPSEKDRILLKVKKLMALAESRNRHEAEAAMAKAHELIAKYNVDCLTRDHERSFESVFVGTPRLRHTRDEYELGRLLGDFYYVYGIWVAAYVIEKGKMGSVLEISGTLPNLKIAHYVHDFVRHFIDSQWRLYNTGRHLDHHRKTDFAVGVVDGLRSKLKANPSVRAQQPQGKALIRVADPRLKDYVACRYNRIVSVRRGGCQVSPEVMEAGVHLGKKLVISKGITEEGSRGKLLGAP